MTEKLARWVVGADALYCVGLGSLLFSQRRRLAELTAYPPDVLAATGTGAVVWGLVVARLSAAGNWRAATRAVAAANAVGVGSLVWFGNNRGGEARRFLTGLAAQIAGFALLQALLARRR